MADTPVAARSDTLRIGACRLGTRVISGPYSVTTGVCEDGMAEVHPVLAA